MQKAPAKSYVYTLFDAVSSLAVFVSHDGEERKSWLIFHCHPASVYTYIYVYITSWKMKGASRGEWIRGPLAVFFTITPNGEATFRGAGGGLSVVMNFL